MAEKRLTVWEKLGIKPEEFDLLVKNRPQAALEIVRGIIDIAVFQATPEERRSIVAMLHEAAEWAEQKEAERLRKQGGNT